MKEETQKLRIFGFAALVVIVGAIILFNLSEKSHTDTSNKNGTLIRENSHSTATGTYNYKVTMVEFGDYQCPACRFVEPEIKKLIDEYKDKVKLVYRHYPLPQHKNAVIAAQAAEAAGEQAKFWEMHAKMYETQDKWKDIENPIDFYVGLAKEFALDTTKFKASVESGKFKDIIDQDRRDADDFAISATPTLYINGEKYAGSMSYEAMKVKIDSILKKN